MYQLKQKQISIRHTFCPVTPANVPISMAIAGMWRLTSKAGSWRKRSGARDAGRLGGI